MFDLVILGATPDFDGRTFRCPGFIPMAHSANTASYEGLDSDVVALTTDVRLVHQIVRVPAGQRVHTWVGRYRPLRESSTSGRLGAYVGVGVWLLDSIGDTHRLLDLLDETEGVVDARLIRDDMFVNRLGVLKSNDLQTVAHGAASFEATLEPYKVTRLDGVSTTRCILLPDDADETWDEAVDRILRHPCHPRDATRWLVGQGRAFETAVARKGRLSIERLADFAATDEARRRKLPAEPKRPTTLVQTTASREIPDDARRDPPPRAAHPTATASEPKQDDDQHMALDLSHMRLLPDLSRDVATSLHMLRRIENDMNQVVGLTEQQQMKSDRWNTIMTGIQMATFALLCIAVVHLLYFGRNTTSSPDSILHKNLQELGTKMIATLNKLERTVEQLPPSLHGSVTSTGQAGSVSAGASPSTVDGNAAISPVPHEKPPIMSPTPAPSGGISGDVNPQQIQETAQVGNEWATRLQLLLDNIKQFNLDAPSEYKEKLNLSIKQTIPEQQPPKIVVKGKVKAGP